MTGGQEEWEVKTKKERRKNDRQTRRTKSLKEEGEKNDRKTRIMGSQNEEGKKKK
jgi:hypothetical protein